MSAPAADRSIAGRYTLDYVLGRGGMGVVWRAIDTLLDRPVAVKEIELPDEDQDALRGRALREARVVARLNHPNVVTLFDVVEDAGRLFLVMELVEAMTLRDIVRGSGPGAPLRVATVGLELLDALVAAHRAGIVHRDVKPRNVMVAASGRVKLADFGIASLQEDTQRTRTGPVGSVPFMAPEQAEGRRSGPATDLWGLGVTLYYAVEGVPPFGEDGTVATLHAIVTTDPRRPERAGPLTPILAGLLAKQPEHRTTADELREQLLGVIHNPGDPTVFQPGPASGGSAAPRPGSWPVGPGTGPSAGPGPGPNAGPGPGPNAGPGSTAATRPIPGEPATLAQTRQYTASAPSATRPTQARQPASVPGRPVLVSNAKRPRRRRRRLLLVAGGIVVGLLALNARDDPNQPGNQTPGIGDPVRDGNFEFVVTSVDCGQDTIGPVLFEQTAQGQFCVVNLTVENVKNEARTFLLSEQKLLVGDQEFTASVVATMAANGSAALISDTLNPEDRTDGALVFDLPESASPDRLELHDGLFSGGVRVRVEPT
ncbi:MAG: protein kinase [Sporichthyaceae bacterium]|nr:protein kinase [Sporichthyaceae bacterium]